MCPACGAADVNTRHARLCHRSGAEVNQHQPLVHATSRFLKRIPVRHQVESGAPFNSDRDLRMEIVIERGRPPRCVGVGFPTQTHAHRRHQHRPPSRGSPPCRKCDEDGSATSSSEARMRNHYARPGHVSFDECSHKLAIIAVESVGRLGREGSEFIDQLAMSVVGGRDGGQWPKTASARNAFYRSFQ